MGRGRHQRLDLEHHNYRNGYRPRGINFFGLGEIELRVPRDREGAFESEWLLERRERFVIRSTGQRSVIDRRNCKVVVHRLGALCRLRYRARVVKIEDIPSGGVKRSVALGPVKEICKSRAKQELRAYLESRGVNSDVALPDPVRSKKTFADHFEWWEQNKLALCKLSYQENVTVIVKTHILPYWGSTPLESVEQKQVQEFIAYLSQTEHKTRDGVSHRLSAVYIHDIVTTLKQIIRKNASEWELTLPEIRYKEQRYFSQEEMSRIITAASGKWKPFFALLAETGLRCGEACGLHVEDLNLESQQLTVRRSVYRGIEGAPRPARAIERLISVWSFAKCSSNTWMAEQQGTFLKPAMALR